MKTIDCTPTWQAAVRIYLMVLECNEPNSAAWKNAAEGLMQCANVAQMYVDSIKGASKQEGGKQ